MTAVGNGGAFPSPEPARCPQPAEVPDGRRFNDIVLLDGAGRQSRLELFPLLREAVADLGRNVRGHDEPERQANEQVHPTDPQEVDEDGAVQDDCTGLRSGAGHTAGGILWGRTHYIRQRRARPERAERGLGFSSRRSRVERRTHTVP